MENNFEYFTNIERRLNIALSKVKNKLEYLSTESAKIEGSTVNLPEFKNWNNWHDLQYRIESRLWDNWSAFKSWHWDNYQFNSY